MRLLFDISTSGRAALMATHNYTPIDKLPARISKCENSRVMDSHVFGWVNRSIQDVFLRSRSSKNCHEGLYRGGGSSPGPRLPSLPGLPALSSFFFKPKAAYEVS